MPASPLPPRFFAPARFLQFPAIAATGLLMLMSLSPASQGQQGAATPAPTPAAAVSAPEYQEGFQAIYAGWRGAMQAKNYASWQAATATYRQVEIRNRIVSQKLIFPDAMFDVPVSAPQLAQLSLIDIYVKGPTATAIYFGKLDFSGSPTAAATTPDSFLVLRFAGEGDAWKFDNMRVVKIDGNSDMLLKMRQSDFSFLKSPEFQPNGVVPPVATPVSTPGFLAELWVSSIGYRTTVEINGQHRNEVVNNTGRDLVIGGLNRGNNRISLKIEPDPTADPSVPKRIEVAVYAAANAETPANRVYHYRADPADIPPGHSATIKID